MADLKQQPFEPTWALIKKPGDYPRIPTEGKISLIWEKNYHSLYHRLSPYTDYNTGVIKGFTKEPYLYTYIDQTKKGLNGLMRYDSRIFPIGSAPKDVIRVSKFLGSGNGIIFLGKQFLLQTGNPYNETRIYNPTSPIVAAGMGLALGMVRPQRFFDTSGGLLGIASSLIGPTIPSLFGTPKINPPSGTVAGALSDSMKTVGGKGLIRAGTAERAKSHLEAAWIPPTRGGFGAIALGMIKSLFQNFIPQTQGGIKARSDEGAYGLMIDGGNQRFAYEGADHTTFGFGQLWIAGGTTTRKNNQYPIKAYRLFTKYDSNGVRSSYKNTSTNGFTFYIPTVGEVGYSVEGSRDANKPGYRYGDSVGENISTPRGEEYTDSDIMVQHKFYADPSQQFPTKLTDPKRNEKLNASLQKVIANLNKVSGGDLYTVVIPPDSRVFSSGAATKTGYDRLFATNERNSSPMNYPLGVMQDYRDSVVVDNTLTMDVKRSRKLPTAGHFDALNTLRVLNKDMKIDGSDQKLKGWVKWEPYIDDQIAFYFYDVVNEKYIPFRASIKGMSEVGNASWEETPFIGRGDKVYSYGGFNRNLSLTFNVVLSSIVELQPTWQRINYLMTLIKPANYTTSNYNSIINRFMIPPMVMITVGDLYKDQPILIQTITMTIPDDVSWETQNEYNSTQWTHLAKYIKGDIRLNYGQVPRSLDISLGMILLEKERAIVGGANFGHAPRQDRDYQLWNQDAVPNGGSPNKFFQSLVVSKNNDKMFNSNVDKSKSTIPSGPGFASPLGQS